MPRRIRVWIRWAWVNALQWSGLLRWAKQRLTAQQSVIVLAFHRVLPDPEFERTISPRGMVMRERTFEETLRYTAGQFVPVELNGCQDLCQNGSAKLRMAFTFDDGWVDNARYAAPIASKYRIPCTIFICSGRMGSLLPFWPERVVELCDLAHKAGSLDQISALVNELTGQKIKTMYKDDVPSVAAKVIEALKTIPPAERREILSKLHKHFGQNDDLGVSDLHSTMTWEEAQSLSRGGVTFGSHTHTHQILTLLPSASVDEELSESKQTIENHLKKPCMTFAYPNGNWSFDARAAVAKAGYTLAFQNTPGAWTKDSDPLLVPRVNVWEGTVVDPKGHFSAIAFDYAVFWRALWRQNKAPKRRAFESLPDQHPVATNVGSNP